ncbi:UDP-N-acetylglucosamine--N-acetylmuramyl-(pentapeptide) pyrophosphoryl-undecaprenol N-acetylglucosamine transferase 2 [Paenibacillus baekrokdamisoli]|uniref:UDP-N-acetylglucosamine--N-acetylmuramyl-(pentapeptide) pyrophosphoryl-undecaprenol N-acetylglucosamine transferase n=1 Tax=Paenibacillus baekrokdamisoli TaxID=1712516 RepID=A0A3G9J086_9BACL|nr:undecaprenyldiphospho-muramoylpentapeptide beta-N-acetylglucosaminyltransferase [Paenibacillus baekrokdamisoli]MBB3071385.1 UDP-N-acetylglucosamine--N-acetylmuramyl-(pentapeptide) pyrophosphoryl-undecaprenol N-acetylglucosamine transferase [Paenibacillus baekrokdamisoli]BBH24580.1 UDP-N-acetylglucosamine--N-acetylmuramyl-(pentapeptide) pyrophosphoryl-undecaprenol N-acetylglucosamine transferase 2 [Paenibacillus baekrokdamisoli]
MKDNRSKRILFTGGGSAGHVTVNAAIIPSFIRDGWKVAYIGSVSGIESQLVDRMEGVDYYGIATGKLRRYKSLENLKDPFRVMKGVYQAYRILRKLKPDVLFSKGGFVSVPVVLAAWMNSIPILIHESDLTPGLANRIAIPFAQAVCVTFEQTAQTIKGDKAVHIGPILRNELRQGRASRGLNRCKFTPGKPVLLIMGGSLGASTINQMVRRHASKLADTYQIIHICGKGQLDGSIHIPGYIQFEYIHDELADVLACTDLVISRAGSNSIFEFLALHKPMLLIPLSKASSRGDQILNAQIFQQAGYCEVLLEEEMNDDNFLQALHTVFSQRGQIKEKMKRAESGDAMNKLIALIHNTSKQ